MPARVLFVCTGNICRSPTADGLLRAKVAAAGLENDIIVDSAGTHGYHTGDAPDQRSIATARRYGVDLSGLRARTVGRDDFGRFDLLIALDRGHRDILLRLSPPGLAHKVRLLTSFVPGLTPDVPDPYYDDLEAFDEVFHLIERCVDPLLDHLRTAYLNPP